SDCTPKPLLAGGSHAAIQVDISRKIQEDPLLQIRRKQEETRRRILEHPVLLQQLREKCASGQEGKGEKKSLKKKKEKHKKKKKKKKRKKGSSSSSDSSSDSDDDLDLKLKQRLSGLSKDDLMKLVKGGGNDAIPQKGAQASSSSSHRQTEPHHDQRERRPTKDESETRRPKQRSRSPLDRRSPPKRRSRSPGRWKGSSESSPSRPGRAAERSKGSYPQRDDRRSQSPRRPRDWNSKGKAPNPQDGRAGPGLPKKKLTAEEIEKKRLEMLENAKWREEQRAKNLKKYREEEHKEAEEMKRRDDSFIRKELSTAAAKETLEGRIRSNIYNIQRGRDHMDKNFARK
ncbi:unnamed protein product, partial [Darwinula stevensoni]